MADPDINALYNEFSGKSTAPKSGVDVDALYKEFSGTPITGETSVANTPIDTSVEGMVSKNRAGLVRGLRDVLDTMSHGVGNVGSFLAEKILPTEYSLPIQQSVENMKASDLAERKAYEKKYNPQDNIDVGRTIGQVAASLPLVPVKAIQLWKGVVGALPTISATGAKIAAPFVNRAIGMVGEGALGGATYGTATAGANDKSTATNITEGALTGAIAAPVLHAVGEAGVNALPVIQSLRARININKLATASGIEPTVARNIIDSLSKAGYTPEQAQAELTKMGSKATLMDLANSLTTEGAGLARMGDTPTAILRNRMEARSLIANNDITKILDTKLGPKPDIEVEKQNVIRQVQKDTSPDYKKAYASGQQLDISGVIKEIDDSLKTAVGGKKAGLEKIRGYLINENGNLKNDIPSLHEVRQAIDDVIEGKQPETSYGKNALNAIKDVRAGVDKVLKTNPEMQTADIKFANKMKVVEGFQTGYDAIAKKTSKESFARDWQAATPETKEAIKKGMRSAIGDHAENASKGELSGAQQLFGSKSVNRANLKLAYGHAADEALDALAKEAAFRNTERMIQHGSVTAEAQAIQAKYGAKAAGNTATDLLHGMMADSIGAHGAGTALALIKRGGAKALQYIGGNRLERLTTGSADILSQEGSAIQKTLNSVGKINQIQNKVSLKGENKFKLPITASAPIGEITYSKRKQINY